MLTLRRAYRKAGGAFEAKSTRMRETEAVLLLRTHAIERHSALYMVAAPLPPCPQSELRSAPGIVGQEALYMVGNPGSKGLHGSLWKHQQRSALRMVAAPVPPCGKAAALRSVYSSGASAAVRETSQRFAL